jgi:hypothetical protein
MECSAFSRNSSCLSSDLTKGNIIEIYFIFSLTPLFFSTDEPAPLVSQALDVDLKTA